jgi:hypothetical protein
MPSLPSRSAALTIGSFDLALRERNDCDLSDLAFIDAYGLVGTACAVRAPRSRGEQVAIQLPSRSNMRGHLAAMGFADFLAETGAAETLPTDHAVDASSVVVPLRSAADSGGEQALSHLLWDQLRAHVDPQVLQAIAEGVWEMVGNALEHSGSDALVMAQVYWASRGGRPPDHSDRVQVVIGDVGQGIRSSFLATGVRNPTDDLEAVNLALEYLVTSVADDPGRGQGLFTTMEQVTGLNGRMIVRSGAGKVSVTSERKREETVPHIDGVLVALDVPLYPA